MLGTQHWIVDGPGQCPLTAVFMPVQSATSSQTPGVVHRGEGTYYGATGAGFLNSLNSLLTAGRDAKNPRVPALSVNNITALRQAVEAGVGIAVLPEYLLATADSGLVQLLPNAEMPELECYLVYPEEMKNVARVQVFRDFLVANAQRWKY